MITTDEEAVAYFRCQCAEVARALPLHQARTFLKGYLVLAGMECDTKTKRLYQTLASCDEQLELIAKG